VLKIPIRLGKNVRKPQSTGGDFLDSHCRMPQRLWPRHMPWVCVSLTLVLHFTGWPVATCCTNSSHSPCWCMSLASHSVIY